MYAIIYTMSDTQHFWNKITLSSRNHYHYDTLNFRGLKQFKTKPNPHKNKTKATAVSEVWVTHLVMHGSPKQLPGMFPHSYTGC